MSLGKALVAAGVVAAVGLVAAGLLLGKLHFHTADPSPSVQGGVPVAQVVYTERTANDASITLPAAVRSKLYQTGVKHQTIAVTRVGFTGHVSTSHIDMTPRVGGRARLVGIGPAVDAEISTIEKTINSSPVGATGNRALFAGLMKITFTRAPVTIISSGLDLADPDNFRSLKWSIPARELVADVKSANELPALHGPVTFVLVPTAGAQQQLGQAQKSYLKGVWTTLLTAAGATSVRFIDATGAAHSFPAPSAAPVPVPGLIRTLIAAVHNGNKVTCRVPASRFIVNKPRLADPAQTGLDLTPCIEAALAAQASFALDGWTSYEGPLTANGKPAVNYPVNLQLSQNRVRTIESLLVNDLGVPTSEITSMTGHGDFNQPYPADPSSPKNRVVTITYTVK